MFPSPALEGQCFQPRGEDGILEAPIAQPQGERRTQATHRPPYLGAERALDLEHILYLGFGSPLLSSLPVVGGLGL